MKNIIYAYNGNNGIAPTVPALTARASRFSVIRGFVYNTVSVSAPLHRVIKPGELLPTPHAA